MKNKTLLGKRILAAVVSACMTVSMMPVSAGAAAKNESVVYAAAYQNAQTADDTTLPDTVTVEGHSETVTWNWKEDKFSGLYSTVPVFGSTQSGAIIEAQVEVIPEAGNPLVYFVDAGRDSGKESKAYDAVQELVGGTLKNKAADQVYDSNTGWGRSGSNFIVKGTEKSDDTKKFETGVYSNSKTASLTYKYKLEPGTYTLTAGFYEWWNNRSMKVALSGDGMDSVTSEAASVYGIGNFDLASVSFDVRQESTVTMEIQNATGGEAPVLSWFAVAEGTFKTPDIPEEVEVVVNGEEVDTAAVNQNGLTYKGFGLLSGNSTSDLLMDYKTESQEAYEEMMQVLFGGEHPLITHVKMEMGNDGNNSTGADSCTMRSENEEADVSRSPGFQLAGDAKKINPDVKVSFLRWEMPAWVQKAWTNDRTGAGYEAVYKWYRETVFDACEKYGYVVDYINPDKNETTDPDEAFIKWFRARVSGETQFPDYMDAAARDAYHKIKIIASDENTSLNIVPSMRGDEELYKAVDAVGFHYLAGDEKSTADYRTLADVDDKEVWYSEGCATFGYTEYQENKTTAYGAETIGGYQSPLALADNFIKSFVYSRKTHYIFQPAVGSFYEGAQYDHKEIVSAREPWAGSIHYDPMIYMLQHFTSFSDAGWENDTNTAGIWRVIPAASSNNSTGSDHLKNEAGNPSYMTLAAPDKSDFSVVMVNNSERALNYRVKAEQMLIEANAPMEIWETKTDSYLQYKGEAEREGNYYTVTVEPYSMVTLTTLDCDRDQAYLDRLPEEAQKTVLDTDASGQKQDITDQILYADDYEYAGYADDYLEKRGNEPRYTVDFTGAFEVQDGALKQVLNTSVNQWNSNDPNCVVGDYRWMNYKAGVNVAVTGSGYAGINIRQQTGMGFEGSGYNLRITKDGKWTLKKRSTALAEGTAEKNREGAYRLELEGQGAKITAWVNGVQVAEYTDTNPEYFGRVRLGCKFEETVFDNLMVEKVAGYTPYASELIDNASDAVIHSGKWDIIAGGNGSNNDWYRSTSTTQEAGASVTFPMYGDGFALIGKNDGSAVLDITVDGVTAVQGAATQASEQHEAAYLLTGIGEEQHEVQVIVKSGTFVLDAVKPLPYTEPNRTPLNELVAQADKIRHEENIVESTWETFAEALALAKEASGKENGAWMELDQAYLSLQNAMDGLKYNDSVVSAEEVFAAVYADEDPKLPGNILCTTMNGDQISKEVEWNTDQASFELYDQVTVTGTVKEDGFEVKAVVEVVPKDLVYFVSCGTGTGYLNNNTTAAVSKPFQAVAALVPELINAASDAAYSDDNGWGYVTDSSSYKVSSTVDGGDRPDSYTSENKYLVGLRDKTAGAKPMTYRFTLEAGSYVLTAGYHEFYGSNRSRDMQPSVVWTDRSGMQQEVKGSLIQLRSADQKGSMAFTLDKKTTVEYRLAMAAGEAPMFSWLAVEQTGEVPAVKGELQTAVEAARKLKAEVYTAESYAAVEEALREAERILEDEKAIQEEVDRAAEALRKAVEDLKIKVTVDKTGLQSEIAAAEGLNTQKYTTDSYSAVKQALETARRILSDPEATQAQVDASRESLQQAVSNLKPVQEVPKPSEQKVQLGAPSVKSVKSAVSKNGSQIKIVLNKVAGADTYTVYRKVGKSIKRIGMTSSGSIADPYPVSGKKASYFAKASSGNKKYTESKEGKEKSITLAKDTAKVKARKAGKSIVVSYKKVKGAKGYLIYRSSKKNGVYTKLTKKPSKKLSYTDNKVKAGKTYYYKVIVYGKNKTYSAGKVSGKVKR